MPPPDWVQDAIFYQIFPDRFANGDPSNDPPNVQKWGSPPTAWGFQGGDLAGVTQHLDYLADLGVTAIYLNPIFEASSTHRYNTSDYFKIDPKLGSLDDFRALVESAHRKKIRIILDGVFNHCGRGFFAFADVLENGENSPYKDWFYIHKYPLDAYSPGEAQNYTGWWNHKSLPKLNTAYPPVREYIFKVARHWIEQGIDGWRLDVPNEIDDDAFWKQFREVVKSANPDAYLLGEIWDINPRWTSEGHFDGLMNYPIREALLALLQGRENAGQFGDRLETLIRSYARENLYAMFVPLDSHDTERFKTSVGNHADKTRLAFQVQMALPGAPSIYYGDEIGLEGGGDPDSRRAFPWQENTWDVGLRSWIKTLIKIRKQRAVLRRGDYTRLLADDGFFAFARSLEGESLVMALNASSHARQMDIPVERLGWKDGRTVHNLISQEKTRISSGTLQVSLPAWNGVWIG